MSDDLREGGYAAVYHQLWSSPDLTGLRAPHLFVFVTLIHLANWKRGHFWVGRHRVDVSRGELTHSLATIAKEARASIREVRTTVDNLLARGVLASRSVSAGDTTVRVLRVVNYEKFQTPPPKIDTGPATASGKASPEQRHGADMGPTPIEPGKPDQPGEPGGAGGSWEPLASAARAKVRANLWKRWFEPLRRRPGPVGVIVLEAPTTFDAAFLNDNYAAVLGELAGCEVRIVAAVERQGGTP